MLTITYMYLVHSSSSAHKLGIDQVLLSSSQCSKEIFWLEVLVDIYGLVDGDLVVPTNA